MGRNGPDLYLKTLEKLQMYVQTTYKNVADIWKCLKQEKLTTFTTPELDENATATQREMLKNSCQQYYQERRITGGKPRGNVQGSNVHM